MFFDMQDIQAKGDCDNEGRVVIKIRTSPIRFQKTRNRLLSLIRETRSNDSTTTTKENYQTSSPRKFRLWSFHDIFSALVICGQLIIVYEQPLLSDEVCQNIMKT